MFVDSETMTRLIKKQCLDQFRMPAKGTGQSVWGAGAIPASQPATVVHRAGHPGLKSPSRDLCGCLAGQSCPILCNSMAVAHQAPPSIRQEYWSGLPFPSPGNLPHPGIEPVSPVSPALQADSLHAEPPLANSKQLFLGARRSCLWAEWAPGQGVISRS